MVHYIETHYKLSFHISNQPYQNGLQNSCPSHVFFEFYRISSKTILVVRSKVISVGIGEK